MNNIQQYIITLIGMATLTIYCFNIFYEIKIFYLFYISICVLFLCFLFKVIYWYKIGIGSERENLLRLFFLVLTFLLPLYMIIQEPTLIIDIDILKLSFLIIFILAFIGTIVERYLLIKTKKYK